MATKTAEKVGGNVAPKKAAAKQAKSLKASGQAKSPKGSGGASGQTVTAGKKRAAKAGKRVAGKLSALPLTHRLEALLHTMRTIAQHEDELCTLLHDARGTGKVSTTVLRELQAVLAALPAQEYTDDLQAVLQLTGAA